MILDSATLDCFIYSVMRSLQLSPRVIDFYFCDSFFCILSNNFIGYAHYFLMLNVNTEMLLFFPLHFPFVICFCSWIKVCGRVILNYPKHSNKNVNLLKQIENDKCEKHILVMVAPLNSFATWRAWDLYDKLKLLYDKLNSGGWSSENLSCYMMCIFFGNLHKNNLQLVVRFMAGITK